MTTLRKAAQAASDEWVSSTSHWRTFCLRMQELRAELAKPDAHPAPAEPQSCSLGCTTECKAKMHGCASECPALPWQPPAPAEPQPVAQQKQAIEHCLWARNGHAHCPQQGRKPLTEGQTKDLKHLRNYVANSDDGEICRGWLAALDVVLGITATKGGNHA